MTAAVAAKRRVLVVDDEENVTHLVSSALRFDGFETIIADNGPSALAAVAESDPDLVVLDVMMPGMDGLGVLHNLRAAGSQVPVIFLTARDAATERIGGLRAGADDYVVKPFSVEELLARVHAVLRRSVPDENREGVLRVADLELDENSHEVTRAGADRAVRRLPAQEGRFGRAEADPHRARRGLRHQGAPKLRPGTAGRVTLDTV